ncbi:MAG: arginase family protein [Gammaproteobacteria bacterium]|nr:arginase family protein [Gammaproteobacteria bacterium]
MVNNPTVHLLGVASGVGASNQGCAHGPLALQQHAEIFDNLPVHWVWENTIYPPEGQYSRLGAMEAVMDISHRLAYEVHDFITNNQKFAIIGGDQSSSIGTWSGMAHALRKQGDIGLIWVDAHLDCHTPSTTRTGNIHGMSMAHLLGYGETALCSILDAEAKLLPSNICFIGIKRFDPAEMELLEKLNIKVFFMKDVQEQGIHAVMQAAIEHVSRHTIGYGISIDMECLETKDDTSMLSAELIGIKAEAFIESLSQLYIYPKLLGVEIAEFNPSSDSDNKVKIIIRDILKMLFLGPSAKKRKAKKI